MGGGSRRHRAARKAAEPIAMLKEWLGDAIYAAVGSYLEDTLGAEEPEDLKALDPEHLRAIISRLKVLQVPKFKKKYAALMGSDTSQKAPSQQQPVQQLQQPKDVAPAAVSIDPDLDSCWETVALEALASHEADVVGTTNVSAAMSVATATQHAQQEPKEAAPASASAGGGDAAAAAAAVVLGLAVQVLVVVV